MRKLTRAASSSVAIRRSVASASAGQRAGSAGHQACASCSGRASTAAPSASQAWPTSIAMPVRAGRRAPRRRAARAPRTTPPRARGRASARGSRRPPPRRRPRAPSAPPTSPPSRRGGRRASGRRRSAPRRARRARRARRRPPAAATSAWAAARASSPRLVAAEAGEPRGEPVVGGRAALLERGDRPVRRGGAVGGRLVAVVAPARATWPACQGPRARMPGAYVDTGPTRVPLAA